MDEPTERRSRQDGCPFVTLREWPRSEQTLHARDETKELSVFLQKLLCGALNPENLNFPDPPRCGLSKCDRTEWLFWRCFFHDVSLREEVSFSLRVTWRCNYTFLSLWDWNRKIYSGFVPLRGSETVTFLFFFCLLNLWRGFKRNINTEEDIHLHHRHRSDALLLLLLLRPSHRLHPSVYLRHKLSHLLTRLWPTRRANT